MTERVKTLDEIWKGDLLGRRQEAEDLLAYIESVATRPSFREDSHGYTIAVDGGYGEGKTFFLKRLKEHIALKHPVAFIDSWADDIADEPLTALAATLRTAIEPRISEQNIRKKWNEFSQRLEVFARLSGRRIFAYLLPWLMAICLFLLVALAFLVGTAFGWIPGVVSFLLFSAPFYVAVWRIFLHMRSSIADVLGSIKEDWVSTNPDRSMDERIKNFKDAKDISERLRESLEDLALAFCGGNDGGIQGPIVIIIDELDRCRPTYAIKLLEEIKHLFDVPGVVFILGMNGDQLAHSVSGAYGDNFDGAAYLRRFINRYYRLRTPDLKPFVKHLLQVFGIDEDRLKFPSYLNDPRGVGSFLAVSVSVSYYMVAYELSIRDAFHVVEMLQVCAVFTEKADLLMAYLLPLIISRYLGEKNGGLIEPKTETANRAFVVHLDESGRHVEASNLWEMAKRARMLAKNLENGGDFFWVRRRPGESHFDPWEESIDNGKHTGFADFRNYPALLEKVGRFSNPNLPKPDEERRLSS